MGVKTPFEIWKGVGWIMGIHQESIRWTIESCGIWHFPISISIGRLVGILLANCTDKRRGLSSQHVEHLGGTMIRGVWKVRFGSCNCE